MLNAFFEFLLKATNQRQFARTGHLNGFLEIHLSRRLHFDGDGFQLIGAFGANAQDERNIGC